MLSQSTSKRGSKGNHQMGDSPSSRQLPPAVEELLAAICIEQLQPPPDGGVRRELAAVGEEEAMRILKIVRRRKIKKTLSGYIVHLARRSCNGCSPFRVGSPASAPCSPIEPNTYQNSIVAETKTQTECKTIIDRTSPLFLGSGDNPGNIIIPCLLDGENYRTWSRLMVNALRSKNKLGFIEGTLKKPEQNSPDVNAWEKCNSMVIAWLFNTLDKSLHGTMAYVETAHEMWVDLEERYAQGNAPRVHQIKREISLLQQNNMSVTEYYIKLKTLWDELEAYQVVPKCSCGCTCGAAKEFLQQQEEEKVHQFLMSLDSIAFGTVRSQILNTEPLPNLNKVYSTVIREERQRTASRGMEPKSNMDAVAFHMASSKQKGRDQNWPKCQHCHRLGHEKSRCYDIIGYPSNWSNRCSNKGNNVGRGNLPRGAANHTQVDDIGTATGDSRTGIQGLTQAQVDNLFTMFKEKQAQEMSGTHLEEADWSR